MAIEQKTGVNRKYFIGGRGVPDFLVQEKDGDWKFIEVKQTEKDLNKNQIEWIKETGISVFVVKLAKKIDVDKELSPNEMKARNSIIFTSQEGAAATSSG